MNAFEMQDNFRVANTLNVEAYAAMGGVARTLDALRRSREVARSNDLGWTVVGQCSNVLLSPYIDRCVAVMAIKGMECLEQNQGHVRVRVAAGEDWHEFVQACMTRGWFGLENLALIPGTVGAAPVQNIGAYGVELAERLECVEAMGQSGEVFELSMRECRFGYRSSRFQGDSELAITAVVLNLHTTDVINTSYTDVADELARRGHDNPRPRDVFEAVIDIRKRKLPDPKRVPNVGSFFKNPTVDATTYRRLMAEGIALGGYPSAAGVKLSAAQLIDLAGWKAEQSGPVRCWEKQPLVLVNAGASQHSAFLDFAERIREDVRSKFGVYLELEPSVIS